MTLTQVGVGFVVIGLAGGVIGFIDAWRAVGRGERL